MRILFLSSITAALAFSASADTKTYDVNDFSEIKVSSGVTLVYEAGGTQSIIAETEDGDLDRLVLKVEGDTLVISRRAHRGFGSRKRNRKDKFTVRVTAPAISSLSTSSGSRATADGFAGDVIYLSATSGSRLEASGLSGSDVEVSASSGAALNAKGTCNALEAKSGSGSSVRVGDLECTAVIARASSGSLIRAHATQQVEASASSGASIRVAGEPSDVITNRSSGGSVSVKRGS